jgi:hypothetical protein
MIEELIKEANEILIGLSVNDSKGYIDVSRKLLRINPVYLEESPETFVKEMLHYHNFKYKINEFENYDNQLDIILESMKEKRQLVVDYLTKRGIM